MGTYFDVMEALDVPDETRDSRQGVAYRTAVIVAAYAREPFPDRDASVEELETFVRERHDDVMGRPDCPAFPRVIMPTLGRYGLADDFMRIHRGDQHMAFA